MNNYFLRRTEYMDKTIKKAIAGLLALTLVIGAMPTNSKGFFKEGKVFTAYADGITYSPIAEQDGYFTGSDDKIYKLEGESYTEVTVINSGSYGANITYTLFGLTFQPSEAFTVFFMFGSLLPSSSFTVVMSTISPFDRSAIKVTVTSFGRFFSRSSPSSQVIFPETPFFLGV